MPSAGTGSRIARRPRILALMAGVLLALIGVMAIAPAVAQAADAEQSVTAWVRQQGSNANLAGVTVELSGAATATATTGDDGKATFPLDASGTYTVTIDEDTLPAGAGYPAAGQNPKTVTIAASAKQTVIFLVSPDNAKGSGAGGGAPSATPSSTTAATEGGSAAPGGTPQATLVENPDGTVTQTAAGAGFWQLLSPKIATGLIFGLLIALAAVGASLIYGVTGLNNFSHGELVTFGALMAWALTSSLGWSAVVAVPVVALLGAGFGAAQNAVLWKPLRKRRTPLIPLMIVSIGLSLVLRYVYMFFFGADRMTLPNDSSPFFVLPALGISLRFTDVIGSVVSILCLIGVALLLTRTRIGKAMRAVSDNRALAASSGINVERVILVVWLLAGGLAALAGVYIGYYQSLRWDTGASILLLIFAAITLGGLGSAWGALVGSLIIGLGMNISTMWIPENLKYVAPLVLMIIILLVRPQGILGRKERIG